ncbi:MAG: hypothetical protein EPO26_08815 [Chloroflexota bacterium]|nr:MAG: hypothetical protein EPO26_08815 [Chloroflexota bacterium]
MFRYVIALAIFAIAQFTFTATALANERIEKAQVLAADGSTVAASVVGNSGGAYRYYRIDYPGSGVPVPISMRAQPGRGTAGVATGFKVYGPAGLFGEAIGDDRSTTDSTYALTLSHATAGAYYIQVFNYIEGLPLGFQLTTSGLSTGRPAAGATPVAAIGSTSPDTTAAPSVTSMTTGGILGPAAGGAFRYYPIDYPGGRTKMSMTIGYGPLAFHSDQAVGFNLYRSDPDGPMLIGSGSESGRNESTATEVFTLEAEEAQRYLLQVFNYLPGTEIQYTLIVTGMTGAIAEIPGVTDPARAFALSAAQTAARSELSGDRAGRYHFYSLLHPGGDRELRITVTVEPSALSSGEFGLNIFKDADRIGTADANVTTKTRRVATLTMRENDTRWFGIQVYNYAAGVAGRYIITIAGY